MFSWVRCLFAVGCLSLMWKLGKYLAAGAANVIVFMFVKWSHVALYLRNLQYHPELSSYACLAKWSFLSYVVCLALGVTRRVCILCCICILCMFVKMIGSHLTLRYDFFFPFWVVELRMLLFMTSSMFNAWPYDISFSCYSWIFFPILRTQFTVSFRPV